MTVQVVVTRPRAEADAISQEIARRGFAPLIAPMLDIRTLETPIPLLNRYEALAFTSVNGARAFAERSTERGIPAYAVGSTTAAALRESGFREVRPAGGDAGALAALIAHDIARGAILHISGRAIARDLGALLSPAGIIVDRVELYDAWAADMLPPDLVAALYACTVGYVLFYSTRTAMTFGTLTNAAGLTKMVRSITAICLSAQVAATAAALPWRFVRTAQTPCTPDMLLLLEQGRGFAPDRTPPT